MAQLNLTITQEQMQAFFKVRENHRIISKALMIAYGINEDGKREIPGFASYEKESKETWKAFLMDLKKHPKSIRQRFVRNFRSCLTAGQSRLRGQREMRFWLNIRMLPKLL